MTDYKILLTQEAISDISKIIQYIEDHFGRIRADQFQNDIKKEIEKLAYTGGSLPKTHILYRNHSIYKKIYPPSIIFYILINSKHELHILRVLREQHDWHNTLGNTHHYTYPD